MTETDDAELRRELGLVTATVYGVGLILGAGIYAILGEAVGITGESIGLSFVLAAVIASFTGLSYAELCSRFPKEEADYIYVLEAFDRKRLSEFTAIGRVFVGVISAAAVALAFGGYLDAVVDVPAVPTAVALVVAMAAVNYLGIDLSAKLNVLFTTVEVAGLLAVIWIGGGDVASVDWLQLPRGGIGVLHAAFLVFFAYLGFGSIVNISEETRDATVTIPRAILFSIGITTVLYVLVGLAAVGVVDWRTLGGSDSPLALVARTGVGPWAATAIAGVALFSTTNTVLILQISTSRLVYGVSKEEYGSLPTAFSRIHPERRTPYLAVALVGAITLPFVVIGDIGAVAGLANAVLLVVFTMINAALLRLRWTGRPHDGFRAPLNVGRVSLTALAGLLSSVGLLAFYLLRIV
jgi:APA family basic amino acid/polyamine antiporter